MAIRTLSWILRHFQDSYGRKVTFCSESRKAMNGFRWHFWSGVAWPMDQPDQSITFWWGSHNPFSYFAPIFHPYCNVMVFARGQHDWNAGTIKEDSNACPVRPIRFSVENFLVGLCDVVVNRTLLLHQLGYSWTTLPLFISSCLLRWTECFSFISISVIILVSSADAVTCSL